MIKVAIIESVKKKSNLLNLLNQLEKASLHRVEDQSNYTSKEKKDIINIIS